jgi:hypothetical protein
MSQVGETGMSRIVWCLGLVLAALTMAAPAWAQSCAPSDIAGVWELYLGLGQDDDDDDDILDDDDDGWSACRIRVEDGGEVSGPCTTAGGSSFRIVGGQLSVRTNCLVSGRFVARTDDDRVALAVPRAALSRSGDVIAGGVRGTEDDDDVIAALFQMIRR